MANEQLGMVLRHLRGLLETRDLERLSDGELLERFTSGQTEAAFTALVRRHGRMVLGVCKRVLHNPEDAKDAFQATFLVLFRKARSLDRRGSLANWLYTVAYRVALKAKAERIRRYGKERQVREMPEVECSPQDISQDLRSLLDEEVNAYPFVISLPVVEKLRFVHDTVAAAK
jgi:DNA-directed RNA polymerase specialized sigma24 family protein